LRADADAAAVGSYCLLRFAPDVRIEFLRAAAQFGL
jgi:hypothetical protein